MATTVDKMAGAGGGLQPWDQKPGEPTRWYGRFLIFLELGPARTLREACRVANHKTHKEVHSAYGSWPEHARRWDWRERATAWDVQQRELLAASERNKMLALRERRVAVMEENLETVREVLRNANLEEADEKQARAWLPQMRVFLRDLLVAERQEYEKVAASEGESGPLITADDLRAAQREMERQDAEQAAAQQAAGQQAGAQQAGVTAPAEPNAGQAPRGNAALFVCAAADSPHLMDLAVLRGVRAATGLRFSRLLHATRHNFAQQLRRERGLGRPIEYLHLALPVVGEGIQFADGWADGNWLSERLLGVRVLLLAGCEGATLGDALGAWLAVVPHVISLGEEISPEDAAVLTQHFWHNIGLGKEPGLALEEALAYCPPAVSEYVVRHW